MYFSRSLVRLQRKSCDRYLHLWMVVIRNRHLERIHHFTGWIAWLQPITCVLCFANCLLQIHTLIRCAFYRHQSREALKPSQRRNALTLVWPLTTVSVRPNPLHERLHRLEPPLSKQFGESGPFLVHSRASTGFFSF